MIALVIIFIVLVIATWVVAVYGSWRIHEHKTDTPLTTEVLTRSADKVARLARRGLYSAERTADQALRWSGKKTSKVVVKVFPQTAPVFAEKPDALTGLTQGPSSYFLKSISQKDKKKSSTPRKKML